MTIITTITNIESRLKAYFEPRAAVRRVVEVADVNRPDSHTDD